jgi:hypothetical protein
MTGLWGGKISHLLPLPEGEEEPDPTGETSEGMLAYTEAGIRAGEK